MNDIKLQLAVKQVLKAKFYGHQTLHGKTIPMYPDSAEREYKRICNSYIRILNKALQEHLPELMAAYAAEQRGDSRFDDIRDLEQLTRDVFMKIAEKLEQRMAAFGLHELVAKIARLTKNTAVREWKREIKETFDVELMTEYYDDAFYGQALVQWVDENVQKVQGVVRDTLWKMKDIIVFGFVNHLTITEIKKQLQAEYKESRRRLHLLARDQVSNLNTTITKENQQNAGCSKYRWSDSRDSRVRDCHRSLNGRVFTWDNPPEMWYETKGRGRVYTGRRCHPGEDYCCRCVAVPVFDVNTVFVPITKSKG